MSELSPLYSAFLFGISFAFFFGLIAYFRDRLLSFLRKFNDNQSL